MGKNKLHYLCVEVDEIAKYLGLDLWGVQLTRNRFGSPFTKILE